MNKTALVSVSGLRVHRDEVILDGINWQVREGEHWVILGANGAGKTSLLQSLTGYLTPTSGKIKVLGKNYGRYDWRELRKRVGVVTNAFGDRISELETAIETVVSGRHAMLNLWREMTASEVKEASEILNNIGCFHIAHRAWRFLSQGERQRVLIGRALMARHRLLILDEPCEGLDPVVREDFLLFIEGLARMPGGPGLVLVTHHVEEIPPPFSHVLMLKKGRAVASGRLQEHMNSRLMSRVFDADVSIRRRNGRYTLKVNSTARNADD